MRSHHASPPDAVQERIRRNLEGIHARIRGARERGAHAAEHVDLVVVTKSIGTGLFGPLRAAGVTAVGENRVQAAASRKPRSPKDWAWHGIGHLQRNKARTALATFDVFHALDSGRLARHLETLLADGARRWPFYVQVNAADDPAKGGVEPDEALTFLRDLASCPHLEPKGFMTLAKWGAEEEELRATFRTLRHVRDEALRLGVGETPVSGLSMGMSDDFELAVEEGSTLVRVGRAVFEGVEKDWDPALGGRESGPLARGEHS